MKLLAILLLLAFTGIAANAEFRCVALYPSPVADPAHNEVETRIIAFFKKMKVEIQASGSATVWISVSAADFSKARAALIEAVMKKEFEPVVVFVPEAWKKRADGVSYYDFKFAEDCIRKEVERNQMPEPATAGKRRSS